MKTDWKWVDPAVVLAIHDQQIAEHGGAGGIRDMGLIESALARPRNLVHIFLGNRFKPVH